MECRLTSYGSLGRVVLSPSNTARAVKQPIGSSGAELNRKG